MKYIVDTGSSHFPSNDHEKTRGFALVVTVTLLVLLAVIAIGLLTLSTITLRASSWDAARREAQGNARLGLLLAIGELQKELGPDQRVTAMARIIEEEETGTGSESSLVHPLWLGSWNSWQESLNAPGIEQTYVKGRQPHFRRWLVSHPDPEALTAMETVETATTGVTMVPMVGEGTLGTEAAEGLQVAVPVVPLESGGYAWWVAGENQKTRVSASEPPENRAHEQFRLCQWPGSGADQLDGLADLPSTPEELEKVVTLPTLGLGGAAAGNEGVRDRLRAHFHDLTANSTGVLANVRHGGLKKDLNLLLEGDELPREFGDYRLSRPSGSVVPIRPNTGDVPEAFYHPHKPNFSSWYELHQYYSLYKGEDGPGEERPGDCDPLRYHRGIWGEGGPRVNFHWHRGNFDEFGYTRTPMVTRLMMVFSTRRVRSDRGRFDYVLSINPVITIWNPYNVTLHSPRLALRFFPRNIEYKVYKDDRQLFDWREVRVTGRDARQGTRRELDVYLMEGPDEHTPIILKPGETRIFSALEDAVTSGRQEWVEAYPGYVPPDQGGGLDVPIDADVSEQTGSQDVEIALRLSAARRGGEGSSHQFYFILRNRKHGGERFVEMAGNPIPDNMSMEIVPDRAGERVRFTNSGRRIPFATVEFLLKSGEQLPNPPILDARGREIPAVDHRCRNFIHANPVNQRHCYGEATDRAKMMAQYVVYATEGIGNALNPDFEPSTNRSYYGSAMSLNGGTWPGQPLVVTTELPSVAPTSLASLMHFKLGPGQTSGGSRNHLWDVSPNQMLGIGNSFAHPLLPADAVYQDIPDLQERSGGRQFYMERDVYDHAFFNNDALWDEWFCSSITRQDLGVFGERDGEPTRLIQNFLGGDQDLPNPHLRPWSGGLDQRRLRRVFGDRRGFDPEAWRYASSHLVLDGAFNVNSTSVAAWKALFWGLRDEALSYLDPATSRVRQEPLSGDRVVISRFSLPCSPEEGRDAGDPASWLGIRLLDEDQIDRLARECVRQVKLRGPFLNLSDFVNRRLERSSELSLCGALQAAIDWDEFGGNQPGSGSDSINGRFKSGNDLIAEGDVRIRRHPRIFHDNPPLPSPHAATGSRFAGIPGYVTQADLLKRIGNMITPRDDTFRIRAYGEARDAGGRVLARAWCEAVVKRIPDYMDPVDEPHLATDDLESPVNRSFGRRLRLVSFRWLGKEEV